MPSRSGNKVSTKGTVGPFKCSCLKTNQENNVYDDCNHNIDTINYENGKTWKSLTANSMADTQNKILQLLRMDYQTFVNSAYLRQGAADQFARETPMKRKEILGEILSLSYFDVLQERCKDKLKPLKEKCEQLSNLIATLPALKSQIDILLSGQTTINNELTKQRNIKESLDSNLSLLQRKEHELNSWQEKQINIKIQLQNLSLEIEHLNKQKEELLQKQSNLNSLVNNQTVLEIEFAEYEITASLLKDLEEKSFNAQSLERQKIELRSKLAAERASLELELQQAQKRLIEHSEHKVKLIQEIENHELITAQYKGYQELIEQEVYLSKQQENYAQLKQRIAELQISIDESQIRLSTEIEQKKEQLVKLASLLDSQNLLEKQKIDLETREIELDKREKEFQYISNKGQDVKNQIESLNQKIKDKHSLQQELRDKIETLNKTVDTSICPLCSGNIVDKAAVINRYYELIKEAENTVIAFQLEQEQLEKELQLLRAKYAELKNEISQRKNLDMQKGQLKEKYGAIKEIQENQNKLQKAIELLEKQKEAQDYAVIQKTSLINLTAELNNLKFDPVIYDSVQAQIRSQRGIEVRYHQLQKDLTEIKKIDLLLPELTQKIDSLNNILAEESYSIITRNAINSIDQQWQNLNYDSAEHIKLREKISQLLPNVDKYKDLKHALSQLPALEKNLKDIDTWLTTKDKQSLELKKNYELASSSTDILVDLEKEISTLKAEIIDCQNLIETLLKEEARVAANLSIATGELENFKDKEKELIEARQIAEDFSYLAECFGKKGIQAIVIENAIPEIELDANRILAKLTDNKMHINLITQQKSKTGNISETLDIVISDDIGTRNYELYSGGEAFKVNFAIRIALSRLLARRAGAKLETLIIDEGFGSQDDYSRDKLVKAIRSIQPDFARILVITHFADVKDMFPTHIQINKVSGVSQIELIN